MDTIFPGDSVSRTTSPPVPPAVAVRSSAPLEPPRDLSHLYSSVGTMTEEQLSAVERYVTRYFDAYGAYCVSGAAVFSGSFGDPESPSGGGSSASSGSSGPDNSFRIPSLTSSRISAASKSLARKTRYFKPTPVPQGFCYSRLFRDFSRESVANELLAWPAVESVLSQSSQSMSSICSSEHLRLIKVPLGYHVLESNFVLEGQESWSAYDALAGFARRSEFPEGTFGAVMRRAVRPAADSKSLGLLKAGDRLGGSVAGIVDGLTSVSLLGSPSDVTSPVKGGRCVYRPDLVTDLMGFDCEMVTADRKKNGQTNVLGRISIVNKNHQVVFDTFVYHDDLRVVNTNAAWGSGITWKDIRPSSGAMEYAEAVARVLQLSRDSLMIGHDARSDVKVLGLLGNPGLRYGDSQSLIYESLGKNKVGLKRAVKEYLGLDIQPSGEGHSSVVDAGCSLALWQYFRKPLLTEKTLADDVLNAADSGYAGLDAVSPCAHFSWPAGAVQVFLKPTFVEFQRFDGARALLYTSGELNFSTAGVPLGFTADFPLGYLQVDGKGSSVSNGCEVVDSPCRVAVSKGSHVSITPSVDLGSLSVALHASGLQGNAL